MTEQVEQQTCIKFCVKLEHSSAETIGMIQKAAAMGNWWWAASSWQCAHACIMPHAEFFCETSSHPGCSVLLQPTFGTLWLLAFPTTKITFEKGRDFRPLMRFRKIQQGSWWQLGELCEVPRFLLWRGLRCRCPAYNISCIFFNKYLYFSYYTLDTFWTDIVC